MAEQFGKYLLLQRLAMGGMAEISLAKQLGLQGFEKLVVVKRILPQYAGEREFVEMFLDEARLAATLTHPNIVQIFDLGQVDGAFFIAMEYVAGQDLHSLIRRTRALASPVPAEQAARILAGACEGLHYAHTRKDLNGRPLCIVHRDVSPANILVSWEGVVKVVDFGIAKAASRSTKTEAGQLKGKFCYMSPEQVTGKELDGRADVFCLGIVLHELLCGRRLFKQDAELAILRDILEGEVLPPSALRPEVPRELDAICLKALTKDRNKRYGSAQEMQLALQGFLADRRAAPGNLALSEYLLELFADDYRAHQELLKGLPTASPEQLASLLKHKKPITHATGSFATRSEDEEEGGAKAVVHLGARRMARRAALLGLIGLLSAGAVAGVGFQAGWWGRAAPTSGTLSVESDPPGARVLLDGKATALKTPGVLQGVSLGVEHTIRLELQGREAREATVRLTPELAGKALSLSLAALPGAMEVSSTPPGATVYVDGRVQAGVTPLKVAELAADEEHIVRVTLEGHEDAEATARLKPGESVKLALRLEPQVVPVAPSGASGPRGSGGESSRRATGTVEIATQPPTDVFLAGRRLGRTPLTASLPAGKTVLSFEERKLDLSTTATVEVEARKKQEVSLTFRKGKVVADVTPWADIYLGDRKLGTTPFAPRELYEGTYSLRLVNGDLGASRTVKVVVRPGQTTVVREVFE